MLTCTRVSSQSIRGHYNLVTPFYRLLWGPHIHHGYWQGSETPRDAQVQLTEHLADVADVRASDYLLDVGCGMGGSAIHLAKERRCRTLGITISPVQRRWAAASSRWQRADQRTEFLCADAERIEFAPGTFDLIWSIECTEHLFNKPRFFRRSATWLKPGGRVAICAWLAGDTSDKRRKQQVYDVCEGFFCPSLGTADDYVDWLRASGLKVARAEDWTSRVSRTWEICRKSVRTLRLGRLARLVDRETSLFLERFDTILAAYESGAMKYGCFVAHKPEPT
jgi:cyclopropane fatty-acyl-phospholipid synthase-like methyltransferase